MPALRAVQMIAMPTQRIEEIISDTNGVAYERADPSTSRVFEELLPHGDIFLARLLNNAVIQPYKHDPTHKLAEKAAVIIVTRGYVELSHMLHMSYDTTHMYMLICQALGLLRMKSDGKQKTIIIPLGAYHPPAELREILQALTSRYSDRRPKVRRLIHSIIERIASILPVEQEAGKQSYQEELLAGVKRGISSQGIVDPEGQIAMSILAEITPLFTNYADTSTARGEQRIAEYLPKYYTVKPSDQQENLLRK